MGLMRNGVTDPAKYARSAFEAECEAVASTSHGRNHQLNCSSFAIGQLVGAGAVDRHEAERRLFSAAQACGYTYKDGAAAARMTISSGLDKGIQDPRTDLNGAARRANAPVHILKPTPRLADVPVPDWTQPGAEGKPKFFAIGKAEPPIYDDDIRRHVYRRDGQAARVKVKKGGQPAWVDYYRVRRPADNAIGWQARKPAGFIPMPYIGPVDTLDDPFGNPAGVLFWTEGEKDADTIIQAGGQAFTFGSGSDVPDCGDLLHGFDVIVVGDNDAAGEKSVTRKVEVVRAAGIEPRVVRFPEMKAGADATDFLNAGHTLAELIGRTTSVATGPSDDQGSVDALNPVDALIERFNAKYMLVNEAGKAIILQPGFDPVLRRRRHDRITTRDFATLYMNELIEVGRDDKDRPILKTVADTWLKHPDRRQYINGITFDPTAAQQDGVLNLWGGFAIKPVPGDWSLMLEHIKDVICDNDPIRLDYLMRWMARLLQRPAEQGEVAVVMRGGEGTGKGTLAKALMRIVGHHGLAIANTKHLTGSFNAHLRDCIFLFADEAFFAGDRSHVGALKSLITEPHLPIEGKFQNVVLAPNFLHLMMASNEEWVVPASLDARRFFVLEVPDTRKNDHPYFGRLWAQMEAGGFAAMLHDLLALDLTGFNVRAVPTTAALQQQRKLSLQTTEAWWLDVLERGYVFRSRLGLENEFARWHDKVTTELLFTSYSEFAEKRNERRPLTRESLGRFMITMGGEGARWRHSVVGEHLVDVENGFGGTKRKPAPIERDRSPGYALGNLEQARTAFTRTTRLPVDWDATDD